MVGPRGSRGGGGIRNSRRPKHQLPAAPRYNGLVDGVIAMRKMLLTLALIGTLQHPTAGQTARPDSPPTILNLGSNVSDGSATVTCTGKDPYSELSCRVYRLWVSRPSLEEYDKSRAALRTDLATKSE